MKTIEEAFTPGADSADDLERRARAKVPADRFAFIDDGSGEQRTVAANRAGYGRFRLMPRVLVEVSNSWRGPLKGSSWPGGARKTKDASIVDTSIELLGTKLDAPIFTCPASGFTLVDPDGDRAVARAAKEAGVGFMLPGGSNRSLEDVAAVAGPARWQQFYWQGNRLVMTDLAQRAKAAGYKALMLTVDRGPMQPTRRRTIRSGYRSPVGHTSGNLGLYTTPEWQARLEADGGSGDVPLTWKNVEWFKSLTDLPFVLKGVLSVEDALRAIAIGADGIMVSNHGGRSLDHVPGTIEVLERILDAVDGRIPVLIDGGVRRATDIAIALGLGAAAVGIGRPVFWALACGGEETLTAYLEDLVQELTSTFGMLGVTSVERLTRDRVSRIDEFLPDFALARFMPPL